MFYSTVFASDLKSLDGDQKIQEIKDAAYAPRHIHIVVILQYII